MFAVVSFIQFDVYQSSRNQEEKASSDTYKLETESQPLSGVKVHVS